MAVSGGELLALAGEIERLARGLHVKKIYQLSETDIVFTFKERKSPSLFISVDKRFGRIFLTRTGRETPKTPTPFAGLLRKHLAGKELQSVRKQPGNRFIRFTFSPEERMLYCRFFAGGGFLLTDPNGIILGESGFSTKSKPVKRGDVFIPDFKPELKGDDEEPAFFSGSPSEEIEKTYSEKMPLVEFEERKTRLASSFNSDLKKRKKLLKALGRDREKLLEFEVCKKMGDLCQIFFNDIPRGAGGITLTDPETGREFEIPLSPELSPRKNIDLLYKKYRKFRTGLSKVERQINKAQKEKTALEEKILKVKNAKDPADLEIPTPEKTQKAARKKLMGKRGKKDKKSFCKLFTTKDGYEILIGRNNIENDELVKRSNGSDLWFHIRDFPGSHVVLRTGKKADIPADALKEAARLALKHSSRAKDKKAVVIYTHVKNIKKPKGAAPGKVIVTREKTIHVRLE